MNTCARLESSSKRDCVQCSHETATLLFNAGKEHWVEKRTDGVSLKGKGSLDTYWLNVGCERAGSVGTTKSESESDELKNLESYGKAMPGLDDRTKRLIDWNVQVS